MSDYNNSGYDAQYSLQQQKYYSNGAESSQTVWPPWFSQPPPPPPSSSASQDSSETSNSEFLRLCETVPPPTISQKETDSNSYNSWHSEKSTADSQLMPPPRLPLNGMSRSKNFVRGGQKHPYPFHSPSSGPYNNVNNHYSPRFGFFPNFPLYFDGYNYNNQQYNNNYNDGNRRYFQNKNRYPSGRPYRRMPYSNRSSREVNDSNEPNNRSQKKRKRPLSQNNPSKKDWSLEDTLNALTLEKELNKKSKDHSLIIKFPDHDLSKEIVASYHPAIENVHFQQPSTPRFCFVTLKESADADAVINELNKQKFGDGFITAEYKRGKEEEQSNNPEDIDPLTLYVGNLAQEITKEEMANLYPRSKRIDIGYAKKMKYTRYAFVRFLKAKDALDAFKATHNKQIYNKSLIVRFRRFNGPVGMPGEPKPQHSTAKDIMEIDISEETETEEKEKKPNVQDLKNASSAPNFFTNFWRNADDNVVEPFRPIIIKKEPPLSDSESDEYESKPIVRDFTTPFVDSSIEDVFSKVNPIKIENDEKQNEECKEEKIDLHNIDLEEKASLSDIESSQSEEVFSCANIKTEVYEDSEAVEDDREFDPFTPNFCATYQRMVEVRKQLQDLSN